MLAEEHFFEKLLNSTSDIENLIVYIWIDKLPPNIFRAMTKIKSKIASRAISFKANFTHLHFEASTTMQVFFVFFCFF